MVSNPEGLIWLSLFDKDVFVMRVVLIFSYENQLTLWLACWQIRFYNILNRKLSPLGHH